MPTPVQITRAMHQVTEPFHSILYFAQEAMEAYEGLGLEPRGQGYVAGRCAPMGPIGPAAAAAVFYNFKPDLFSFALPGAWDIASPTQVLQARAQAMEALYQRVDAPTDGLEEATDLARTAAAATTTAGRPLAAANKAVPAPGTPFADLWQAMAVVREYRGDGHVALLTAEGVGPVEALVLYSGFQERVSRRFLQSTRLWDDEEWGEAEGKLRQEGLWGEDGLTKAGAEQRERLEQRTDELAIEPWEALGPQGCLRLFDLMQPILVALNDAEAFPRPAAVPSRPDQ